MICVTVFTILYRNWFHTPWFWNWVCSDWNQRNRAVPAAHLTQQPLLTMTPGAGAGSIANSKVLVPCPQFYILVLWILGEKTTGQGRNAGMFRRFQASHKTPNTSYIVISVLQLAVWKLASAKKDWQHDSCTWKSWPWTFAIFCLHVQQTSFPCPTISRCS